MMARSLQGEAYPITSQHITRQPTSSLHRQSIHAYIHRHDSHRRYPTTTQSPHLPHMPDRPARDFDQQHLSADMQLEFPGVHKGTFPLDRVPTSRNVRHALNLSGELHTYVVMPLMRGALRRGESGQQVGALQGSLWFLGFSFATKLGGM